MAAIDNISLTDGATTPLVRVYNPVRRGVLPNGNGIAHYENRAGGVPLGYDTLQMGFARPNRALGRKTFHLTAVLRNPILETLSNSTVTGFPPGPTESYFNMIKIEAFLAERSTTQSRKDLRCQLTDLTAESVWTSIFDNLDFPW